MNKISLRWRITILMGVLVLFASILLTALSIHNATNNFVIPLTHSRVDIKEYNVNMDNSATDENQTFHGIPFNDSLTDFPEGVFYASEIDMNVENARQSFSVSSLLYMAMVTVVSMVAAYYLAGRAMRPISKFNDEMELIDGDTLSKRVSIPQTKDEIENLSLSFNRLLERLEQEFEREKQFSANVAHELKTPLATIMTSAQVLKLNNQTTPEEYRDNLDITLQSARRLSSVVEGLLMLCRTDSEISFAAVDMTQMFNEIQKEMDTLFSEKHIATTFDLNTNTLMVNQLLIYRAFYNLIENAYKYTEQNGTITITSFCEESEVVIRISDTGIGIPADDIVHIFEPFYRADKSRSRKIAGAGLGLAITKEIFDIHKAHIAISSKKNNGTIVEVRF